jgi:hypothetical protein
MRVGSKPAWRGGQLGDQHEHGGAGRDERVRAKPRATASPLTLEPDQRAAEHGGAQAEDELVPGHVYEQSLMRSYLL